MYLSLVGAGFVSSVDFWKMHPFELWWLIEAKMPKITNPSGMSDELIQELSDLLDRGHF